MTGLSLQAIAFYLLLGAFVGLVTYLWERRHWRHEYQSDLLVYILAGALLGTGCLMLLIVAAPGIILLRMQDTWRRRIPEHVPGTFPWLKGLNRDPRVGASGTETR